MSFTANGPGVDVGVLCASGTLEDLDAVASEFPRVEASWRSRYVCDDGSGSFILTVTGYRFEYGTTSYGVGTVMSGTGDLADLTGGGSVVLEFDPATQTFTGRMWRARG